MLMNLTSGALSCKAGTLVGGISIYRLNDGFFKFLRGFGGDYPKRGINARKKGVLKATRSWKSVPNIRWD
jgi:hypothetical protein